MALHKQVMLKSGIMISHWVIKELSIDRNEKRALIAIYPYISKEVMENGAVPIESERIVVRVEDLEYPAGIGWQNITHYTKYFSPEASDGKSIYDIAYNYLKSNIDFFRDAVDA